ncbi:MAG: UvrD-helicase domain-containing protein [Pseudomonadota bacterium]|nr:UvrD-helicase domain-containing protein [Pseudomonadota bacterium]MDP1904303.1 UvrD-helicase domain-containing protein [Pseudomonadota bacterium]MDP2351835.1 UvrD-helicase domain-containing protein [Pseudomonadota bacterium]
MTPLATSNLLADLNPQQREAVKYLDSPLLVLAGAGSGKTRVITRKIAYLATECGIDARHIAAITFTNKAAREMRERVGELLPGKQGKGLTVSTFHSLGLQILRHEARRISYKPRFSVLDAADAQQILADILKTTDKNGLRQAAAVVSNWKNALLTPGGALQAAADEAERQYAVAYQAYQDTLRAYQAMDFDDLIRLPVQLFQEHPEALATWQGRLRYLLVDEYQDTNGAQYAMMKLLAGPAGRFTAVGDDDQAIYAWRGADVENLRRLGQDYPGLKIIPLTQNYRSSQRILAAANSVIRNNPRLHEKNLWSEHGLGDHIELVQCRDDRHEAESVALRISAHKFEYRTRFADYAILYRGNHQARLFEEALREAKIPYVLSGGQSFFDKAEIKDLSAYMRLIANPDDDPAFIRAVTTPRRGVGAATLEKLGDHAGQRHISLFTAAFETGFQTQLPPRQLEPLLTFCDFINRIGERAEKEPAGQLLQELLAAIHYEEWLYDSEDERAARAKWENVREFVEWLSKKGEEDGKTLIDLTQTITLMNLLEGRSDETPDAVRLSTLHAAKGLEYPYVYLVGVEEEILPHRECLEGPRLEEERRLMYVGITRARRGLVITYCGKRKRGGEMVSCEPSRFLSEIDQSEIKRAGVPKTADGDGREEGRRRLSALKAMLGK